MKGLLLAVGLIAALFVSNNTQASIYDTSSSVTPKITTTNIGKCYIQKPVAITYDNYDAADCNALAKSWFDQNSLSQCTSVSGVSSIDELTIKDSTSYFRTRFNCLTGVKINEINISSFAPYSHQNDSYSCPPDGSPTYILGLDTDGNSKIDKCFNPEELDNASNCSSLFNSGSILPAGGNTAPLVCKTFEDGSRCAFSKVEQGATPYYQPNLEKGCFGDAEEIPDYDNDTPPSPQPEQCVPYAGGFACSADPSRYCDSSHVCVDGCGYVNDQFLCFRDQECTGSDCKPAPVTCENTPDAPICKEDELPPDSTYCQKNPTVPACQSGSNFCELNPTAPSCSASGGGTGGGGSDFVLDYDKLINGMKDAVKLIIDTNETPEFSEFKSEIDDKTSELDSEIDNFMNGSHFDGINDQISSNPFTGQFQLPSGGGCTAFDLGGHSLDLCGAAQKISSVLYYVFSFLTLLYLKNLFFSTVTPRKE